MLYANDISQHSTHRVLPEDNDLLMEKLDSAWVAGEVNLGHFSF